MVAPNAYTWTEFVETTATPLYGVHLNRNFDYVSAIVNKGITGGNIATDGIDSAALIADGVITHGALDKGTGDGCRIVRIGMAANTTAGYFVAKGTVTIPISALTTTVYTTTVITYSNGDVCTTGEPLYNAAPYFNAVPIYNNASNTAFIAVQAVGWQTALVKLDFGGTLTCATSVAVQWMAVGGLGA
jgi:hypothetical protein